LQDWATEFKGWSLCRIDGSTKPLDRREEMKRFQTGGDTPGAPHLFLLSTRAGGLGITLTAADTVVFYDQDWVSLTFQARVPIRRLTCFAAIDAEFAFVSGKSALHATIRIRKWTSKHRIARTVLGRQNLY
jgi:hypothetical protein